MDANCPYGADKDSKSEWHIHMQELFPPESLEVRFKDENTGELHIAGVYLEQSKTVIEFQHSPISAGEFRSRTLFHANNGRRIVWVFDERGKNPDSEFGRLRQEDDTSYQPCYTHYISNGCVRLEKCSIALFQMEMFFKQIIIVCVYYGEEDTVHRLIGQDFDYSEVVLSVHPIKLYDTMDVDEFFMPESHWLSFSQWKEMIEERNRWLADIKCRREEVERQRINAFLNRRPVRRGPRF